MISLSGRLVIGEDYRLRESVRQQLEVGRRHIILNFAGVTAVDSDGVGELITAYNQTRHRGARLSVVNLPPRMLDILSITRLITVLEIYETEAEALASQ